MEAQTSRPRPKERLESPNPADSRFLTNAYVWILVIAFYYLVYRYPFQISSSTTSPTYTDTPVPLQVGKYLLLGVVVAAVAIGTHFAEGRRDVIAGKHPLLAACVMIASITAIAKGLLVGDVRLATFGFVIFPAVLLFAAALRWRVSFAKLGRVTVWFAVLVIAVEGVQVALFQMGGRLPALAYEGTTSVRFGSILDDPNGMGILISLLVPVVWVSCAHHKLWRLIAMAGLFGTLVLTQSFTAIAAFIAAMALGGIALVSKSGPKSVALVLAFFALAAAGYQYAINNPVISQVVFSKAGSIGARNAQIEATDFDFVSVMGLATSTQFIESSYVGLLFDIGLVPMLLFFGVGLVALALLFRRLRAGEKSPLIYGLFFYVIAYLIGSVNLRLDDTYPLNILYVVAICLAVSAPTVEVKHALVPRRAKLTAGERLLARTRLGR